MPLQPTLGSPPPVPVQALTGLDTICFVILNANLCPFLSPPTPHFFSWKTPSHPSRPQHGQRNAPPSPSSSPSHAETKWPFFLPLYFIPRDIKVVLLLCLKCPFPCWSPQVSHLLRSLLALHLLHSPGWEPSCGSEGLGSLDSGLDLGPWTVFGGPAQGHPSWPHTCIIANFHMKREAQRREEPWVLSTFMVWHWSWGREGRDGGC